MTMSRDMQVRVTSPGIRRRREASSQQSLPSQCRARGTHVSLSP